MRLLHLDTGREMRGGQWQALRLIAGLAEAGHDPVLLAPRDSPLLRHALAGGLPAEPLRVAALAKLSSGADLVHVHDGRSHTLAAAIKRAPLVVARRVAFRVGRNPASRWKYTRADHYIAVSEHVKGTLLEAGIPPGKISVVYDGVPLAEPGGEGSLIVAPATSDPAKGAALVERAAAIARVAVHFSSDLETDLAHARLFLYITHREGLGSAALLAMARGVPVVASRVGGLPEIVEHDRTGLLVDNTPQSIAEAVVALLHDPPRRRRLAARAREVAGQRFSVAAMIRGTLEVYFRVVSCSNQSSPA